MRCVVRVFKGCVDRNLGTRALSGGVSLDYRGVR
jgi:hypothetical protein